MTEQRTLDPSHFTCRCVKRHTPRPDVLHSHHVKPLSMGGPDIPSNQVPLCPTAHDNVHWLIRHLLAGQPIGKPNPYLLGLARRAL